MNWVNLIDRFIEKLLYDILRNLFKVKTALHYAVDEKYKQTIGK